MHGKVWYSCNENHGEYCNENHGEYCNENHGEYKDTLRREEKHRRSSREHGLESRLNEFQFTSVTTLLTEVVFGVYNRDQVVPSALDFKYLSSRSALECAIKSALGLGFKRKRETGYEHRDDCQMPLLYTMRKDDCSLLRKVRG